MKIIFLDIDGVLNSIDTFIMRDKIREMGYDALSFDDIMVERLANIVNNTGSVVVLTSMRKNNFDFIDGKVITKDKEAEDLLNLFNTYNIIIHDKTECDKYDMRDMEILQWLSKHQSEVDNFVIIDDVDINNDDLRPFFIKTNFCGKYDNGLCDEHVKKAIDILNNNLQYKLNRQVK